MGWKTEAQNAVLRVGLFLSEQVHRSEENISSKCNNETINIPVTTLAIQIAQSETGSPTESGADHERGLREQCG